MLLRFFGGSSFFLVSAAVGSGALPRQALVGGPCTDDIELRRLAGADFVLSSKFALELLFVLGFESLFAGRLAGTDCSLPIVEEGYTLRENSYTRMQKVSQTDPAILSFFSNLRELQRGSVRTTRESVE